MAILRVPQTMTRGALKVWRIGRPSTSRQARAASMRLGAGEAPVPGYQLRLVLKISCVYPTTETGDMKSW